MLGRNSAVALCVLLAGCGSEAVYPAQCGTPLAGWRTPSDGYGALSITNRVSIKQDGSLRWNGKRITPEQLRTYSSMLPEMNPIPFTILQIDDGASCSRVQEVREAISNAAKCVDKYGSTCGEGGGQWAIIGDVIGPNGETSKYFPDGRSEIIQPTDVQRAALKAASDAADAAAERARQK